MIACVTGASGTIGRHIVQLLLQRKCKVRVLSRRRDLFNFDVETFDGAIDDEALLKIFLRNCNLLFHCAAELSDISKMWDVNVAGTEKLFGLASKSGVDYLCYMSSAGVVGRTSTKYINENTTCNPETIYEQSKWAAEQIVQQGLHNCRVVILRPTNVIDDEVPGALLLPMRSSWSDRLKVFLKGGECAHIVHAMDVADAAVYLIAHKSDGPSCFFVSCDHERLNTYGGLWSLYRAIERNWSVERIEPILHVPIIAPYLLRKLWRGTGNPGNVRYSSEKLLSTGFCYRLGVEGAVRRIVYSRYQIAK
jgi:nucleoside-diphosphate-sugar epimerase